MKKNRYLGHFTICEKLREIFRETKDENIKYKARQAMSMAKRMQEKLKQYRDAQASREHVDIDDSDILAFLLDTPDYED
jgi:hypothetical protein